MTENRFAELTVKLWRLRQRFDSQKTHPEARAETAREIKQVLQQLAPEEN